VSGPNGVTASQTTAPAPTSNTRNAARKIPTAPEPLFLLLVRLRRTIRFLLTFHALRRFETTGRFVYFNCTGQEGENWLFLEEAIRPEPE
jgi:hypothetical protein